MEQKGFEPFAYLDFTAVFRGEACACRRAPFRGKTVAGVFRGGIQLFFER
jgi:hypothetical protein